ncbi:MAG: BrnA antitoxin family protein, partial [Sedimenticola sp.]
IRLSPDVTAFFRATGKGWQTRLDEALREYVETHR